MVKEISGSFDGSDFSVAIVCSEFNELITNKLLSGAKKTLIRSGTAQDKITVYRVPGSFEIPTMVRTVLSKTSPDGVIALGAVIRGETPHFDYVCSAVSTGLSRLNCQFDSPITFGVLTTDTVDQALERAGSKLGNKGSEAAIALVETMSAIEMI